MDEVRIEFGFVLWKDQEAKDLHYGGASFEVWFGFNHDAYYVAKLAEFYYLTDEAGNRYTIKTKRRCGQVRDPEDLEDGNTVSDKEPVAKWEGPRKRGRGRFRKEAEAGSASSGPVGGLDDAKHLSDHPLPPTFAQPDPQSDSDSDCDDLKVCGQCTLAVDPGLRTWANIANGWKYSETEGYGICQHDKLFCSEVCVTRYLYGSTPTPPTAQMLEYQGRRDRQACQDLLLHQSYKRHSMETEEDWEGEAARALPEGRHVLAEGNLRLLMSTMSNMWSDAKGGRAVSQASAPARDFAALQREARNLRMTTQKELDADQSDRRG
jgi:hypothetical protein